MKRTWVIGGAIVAMALLTAAGVGLLSLRLVDRAADAPGQEPRDLCERVDPAPLRSIQLVEPTYRRTLRQNVIEGLPIDTCELSLDQRDIPEPTDASTAPKGSAILWVHVTRFPDAAAAQTEFERSRRLDGASAQEVTGVGDRAFVNFDNDEYGAPGYEEIELTAQQGAKGVTVRLVANRDSPWEQAAARQALGEIARRALA